MAHPGRELQELWQKNANEQLSVTPFVIRPSQSDSKNDARIIDQRREEIEMSVIA